MQNKYILRLILLITFTLLTFGVFNFYSLTHISGQSPNYQLQILVSRQLIENRYTPLQVNAIDLSQLMPLKDLNLKLNISDRDQPVFETVSEGQSDENGIWNTKIPPLAEGKYWLEVIAISKSQKWSQKLPIKVKSEQAISIKTNKTRYFPGETVYISGSKKYDYHPQNLHLTISGKEAKPLSIPLNNIDDTEIRTKFQLGPFLNKGIYYLKLFSNEQLISIKKIILIHSNKPPEDGQILKFRAKPLTNQLIEGLAQKVPIYLTDFQGTPLQTGWIKCGKQNINSQNGWVIISLSAEEIKKRIDCFIGDSLGNLQKIKLHFSTQAKGYYIYSQPIHIDQDQIVFTVNHNLKSRDLYYTLGQGSRIISNGSISLQSSPQKLKLPLNTINKEPLWLRTYLLSNPDDIQWNHVSTMEPSYSEAKIASKFESYLPGQPIELISNSNILDAEIEYFTPEFKMASTNKIQKIKLHDVSLFTQSNINHLGQVIFIINVLSILTLISFIPGFLTILLIKEKPTPLGVFPSNPLRTKAIKILNQFVLLLTLWLISSLLIAFIQILTDTNYYLLIWGVLLCLWGYLQYQLKSFNLYFKRFNSHTTTLIKYTYIQSLTLYLLAFNNPIYLNILLFLFQSLLLFSFSLFFLKAFLPFIHPGHFKHPINLIRHHFLLLIGLISTFCFYGYYTFESQLNAQLIKGAEHPIHTSTSRLFQRKKPHDIGVTFLHQHMSLEKHTKLPPIYKNGKQMIKVSLISDKAFGQFFYIPVEIKPSVITEFKLPKFGLMGDKLVIPINSHNYTSSIQAIKLWIDQLLIKKSTINPQKNLVTNYLLNLNKTGLKNVSLRQESHSNQMRAQKIYVAGVESTIEHSQLNLSVKYPKTNKIIYEEEIPLIVKFSHKNKQAIPLGLQIGIPAGYEPIIENILDTPHKNWLNQISLQQGYLNLSTNDINPDENIQFHIRLKNVLKGSVTAPSNHLFLLENPDSRTIKKNPVLNSL